MNYIKEFEKLENDEKIIIPHNILSIKIQISRKEKEDIVLNMPVKFYSIDSARIDYINLQDNINKNLMLTYIETHCTNLNQYIDLIMNTTNMNELEYISNVLNKGLNIGDKIELKNGLIGEVIYPSDTTIPNVRYKVIKKNGELGKVEKILYRNENFKKI